LCIGADSVRELESSTRIDHVSIPANPGGQPEETIMHFTPDTHAYPRKKHIAIKTIMAVASVLIAVLFTASALPASAASLSRSVEVDSPPSQVWSAIGQFCAIRDWHPAIGTCTEDGKVPSTRTLVTKDGKATFVELQTALDQGKHEYSYTFVSSPLPVSNYNSTLKVAAKGGNRSVITWSGEYTPDHGKEAAAVEALAGIYESGLQAIKVRFEK
jgi:hypothetical protein